MRAYVRARGEIIGLFTFQFLVFQFELFRVVLSHCISQNKPLFFLKQAVVFPKTSRRFS